VGPVRDDQLLHVDDEQSRVRTPRRSAGASRVTVDRYVAMTCATQELAVLTP
jgi:hypothetical protein